MSSKLIIMHTVSPRGLTRVDHVRVLQVPNQQDMVHLDECAYRVIRVHHLADHETPDRGNPHHHQINRPGPERPVALVEVVGQKGERTLNAGADLRAEQAPSLPQPYVQEPGPVSDSLPSRELLVTKLRECKTLCDGQRQRIGDLISRNLAISEELAEVKRSCDGHRKALDDANLRVASIYQEHQLLRGKLMGLLGVTEDQTDDGGDL